MIIRENFTDRWLAPGSSPVDWCEDNYTVSDNIAEFTNTISNVFLITLPLMMVSISVWKSYVRLVSIAPVLMFLAMSFVGLSSAYFHGTLSLMGQFLDEIAIAWTECLAYAFLTPKKYQPVNISEGKKLALGLLMAVFMTWLWITSPFFYSFWILFSSLPGFVMVLLELFVHRTPITLSMAWWIVVLFIFAVTAWLLDKLLCGLVLSMGFAGTHQIFHLTITFSCYVAITMFAFWKAQDNAVNVKSTIKYFPGPSWGLPYVHCEKIAA